MNYEFLCYVFLLSLYNPSLSYIYIFIKNNCFAYNLHPSKDNQKESLEELNPNDVESVEQNTGQVESQIETPNITLPNTPTSIAGNNPPTVILYVTPIVKKGTAANIEWRSSNTTSCVAGGAWSGGKSTEGVELTADLFEDSTYTINCFGRNGTTTSTVNTVVFEEQESFIGRIQNNIRGGLNRILEVFRGGAGN